MSTEAMPILDGLDLLEAIEEGLEPEIPAYEWWEDDEDEEPEDDE